MANTYTQLYVHLVFATKERCPVLTDDRQNEIYAYITALVRDNDSYLFAIGGTDDHLHLLISLHPSHSVSDMARIVKANSSRIINKKEWLKRRFSWQEGYGAFTCSQSNLDQVIHYIKHQKEHHSKQTFLDEYKDLLFKYQIEYNHDYIFTPVE